MTVQMSACLTLISPKSRPWPVPSQIEAGLAAAMLPLGAYVVQLGDVYNVLVIGERGVITGIKGLTERELGNLARNYGWKGYP